MEAIRKQNHRSSNVTRSRSQSLLHRNRSGRTRPDSFPRQQKPYVGLVGFDGNGGNQESSDSEDDVLIKDLRKKAKRDDEDLSRRLAKDLRARRVYSPQSKTGASDQRIADLGFVSPPSAANSGDCVDDVMMSAMIEPTKSSDSGLSCEVRNFDGGNTDSSDEREILQDRMQVDGKNVEDCSEEINDLGEESLLTTPPDTVICGNLKVSGDEGKTEEGLRVNDAPFAGNAEEISGEGFSGKDDQLNGSVPRSKSVLRPRLPGKLFKAPGSVSYRKLFPFLMDIMGDDPGTPKLGHCHEDEKGMNRPEFQFFLSSQSHEISQHEPKTNSFSNGSNLTSSPMQLDAKEVSGDCLPVPYVDDKCASESKADPTADFHGAKDVGNALDNDDFKQNSPKENKLDHAKATNNSSLTSEQIGILNQDCVPTTPDAEIHDNSVVNVGQLQSMPQGDQLQSMPHGICSVKTTDAKIYDNSVVNVDQLQSMPQDPCHVKSMELTQSTQESIFEGHCPKADKTNDLPLKRKNVPRLHWHGRLFKTPGSVSYKRLLPFIMSLNKDDSGTSKFGDQIRHKKDEADMYANGFQLPLPSQSEKASINGHMTVSGSMHDTIESKALENNILIIPAVELSHGSQPKLTSSPDTTELLMQFDAKVVHELSASSVKEHLEKVVIGSKDECLSESKFDSCSRTVDFHCARIVANAEHSDVCNQVENEISGQDYCGLPPKSQNKLSINGDISDLTFEHHSSKEKEFTSDSEGRKQFLNLEKHESVSSCPPEGQSLSQLGPNMLEVKNEASSLSTSKSDDALVLNHVSVPIEPRPQPSEKITSEKTDMAAHGDKAGSVLKGLVNGSRMPSKGSNNKHASSAGEIQYGSNSNIPQVLNRCPRIKMLNHAGSFNYKRLLPFITYNSRNSGTQKEAGLQACDLNNDSSSSRSQIPLINDTIITREDATSSLSESSVCSEVIGNSSFLMSSNEEKPPETDGSCQSPSHLKVAEKLRVHSLGFKKGILRNPRGCRGLCTCLKCVSFRLHAESAFEFSTNQLLDAEEVAQDLMKELSHLRNLLERSTDSDSNSPAFNGSQMKEACRKAFETEQLANDRLSQMKDDLNIHCRIPNLERPRVKFSDHVEEKIIQSDR